MTTKAKLARLAIWWRELLCRHTWRPALETVTLKLHARVVDGVAEEFSGMGVINGMREYRRETRPVRVCSGCEKIEVLSEAEFYAQFGRIPRIGAS
jgi:hypothetical protein